MSEGALNPKGWSPCGSFAKSWLVSHGGDFRVVRSRNLCGKEKYKPSILMTLNKMWMRRREMVPNKRMPSAMGSCAPWLALSTTTH